MRQYAKGWGTVYNGFNWISLEVATCFKSMTQNRALSRGYGVSPEVAKRIAWVNMY